MNWSDPASDPLGDIRETVAASYNAGLSGTQMMCPHCGGTVHHEVLIGSEEIVCDDPTCTWDGVVIDILDP